MKLFIAVFLIYILPVYSENWIPRITLKNGSTGASGTVESIKIIALEGGMNLVGEFSNQTGNVTLPAIQVSENVPILIQATYKGVNYNKMVPPVAEFRNKVQEIIVYEKTSSTQGMKVQSLIQITRATEFLRIHKVYLLNNSTNYSIENPEKLQVYIPENAVEVTAQLTQGKKGMPIPLSLNEGSKGKKIDRAILPGESNLQVSYSIPSEKDQKTELKELPILEDKNMLIVFLKPEDISLEIHDGKAKRIQSSDVPDGMGVLNIEFEKNKLFTMELTGGDPFVEEGPPQKQRVVNGTFFTTPVKSFYGVLAMLALFFSLSFFFVYKK